MHRKSFFITLTLHLISTSLLSSPTLPDSLQATPVRDSTRVYYFKNDFEQFGFLHIHDNDTSLTGFQNYDPLLRHHPFFAILGNFGQNHHPLFDQTSTLKSGFDYGIHTSDGYLFLTDSVKYYKVYKTYTELLYKQGAKKEQQFDAVFSRNIYQSFNLGFNFRVMDSPGAYTRQRTNHINFVLTAQLFTKNKRYGIIANFIFNRLRNFENGGIQNDSLFEQNIEPNRKVIPIWLTNAQNRIKESSFFMKHYFDLTPLLFRRDTAVHNQKNIDLGRITYSFLYDRMVQNYIDANPASGYYSNIYLDSTLTYDSITIQKIVNEIIWSNPSFNRKKQHRVLQLEAGFRLQYIEITDHYLKHYLLQYIPFASIYFHPISTLSLIGTADYVFGDYNDGDFNIDVRLSQILGSRKQNAGIISLTGKYLIRSPGWFYTQFLGNNFMWDSTWTHQELISGGAEYAWKFLQAGINIDRLNHYMYLNSSAIPAQYNRYFGIVIAWLKLDAEFWRFTIQAKLAYQTVHGTSVIRLPGLMGNITLYYSQPLFHGAAMLQPGLNIFYNSPYYANAYMPATRSFYLQDEKEIGNYIYMDAFINVKIQRARFFVMYSNFNSWFMKHTYYTVPHYPMQDASFKFGITWRFHD